MDSLLMGLRMAAAVVSIAALVIFTLASLLFWKLK